jgi:BirA family transcriptional regulator, biotin operon repressor / biotin---[acetyl-CoA-carboxylase] ligase
MTRGGFDIVRLPRVASTQEVARMHARSGCRTGTVILANEQTTGRGRDGRAWESAPGLGLWLSLVHRTRRPPAEWPVATSIAALGVALACDHAGIDAGIKWPNDVWLSDRKAAGILADTDGETLLIGIGINVLHDASDFSAGIRPTATSIAIERRRRGLPAVDRQEFLDVILDTLGTLLEHFESAGPQQLLPAVWERSVVRDRHVAITLPSGDILTGRAVGLGPAGELRLRHHDEINDIASGRLAILEEK